MSQVEFADDVLEAPMPVREVPRAIDAAFLARILAPYSPTGTDYLRSASVMSAIGPDDGPETTSPIITTRGRYRIPSSCYIQSTGHFNAVEFLICFNQLAYVTFGHLIASGVLTRLPAGRVSESCRTALQSLSIGSFFDKQLSSMFILRTESRFKRVIDPNDFTCELSVKSMMYRHRTFFTDTECRFRDADGGEAEGGVLLAYPLQAN